ncbi:hypothetical protein EDB86DRAFT_3248287 [Lactarius hatsudake]|nr:hypothetical protein EDB86DRAFT_3248287 [Lactarius hatsudake]
MQSDFLANSGRFPPWPVDRCGFEKKWIRQGLEPAASVGIIRAGLRLHQGQRHPGSITSARSGTTPDASGLLFQSNNPQSLSWARLAPSCSTAAPALKPAALFSALGGALKVLALALVPLMWTSRTHGRLLGTLGHVGVELELLKLSFQMGYAMAACLGSGTDCHASNQVFQGGSTPVASRTVERTSAGINITLRRVSCRGALGTPAGGVNLIHCFLEEKGRGGIKEQNTHTQTGVPGDGGRQITSRPYMFTVIRDQPEQ